MRHGVVMDTNVALLLILSAYDPQLVGRKTLASFTTSDLLVATSFVDLNPDVLMTAHVHAEVSNLAVQSVPRRSRDRVLMVVKRFMTDAADVTPPVERVVDHPSYPRLGVTDAGLLVAAGFTLLLLTEDKELRATARAAGSYACGLADL